MLKSTERSNPMNQSTSIPSARFFAFALCLFMLVNVLPAQEESKPRLLEVGQVYLLKTDAHTGDMGSTQPKQDVNDGKNGDNSCFIRHNIARAHLNYWYSSKKQVEEGEPDPNGEQWVDYRPPIHVLGAGRYSIRAQYREGRNRAPYPAVYVIHHQGGESRIEKGQNVPGTGGLVWLDLGRYELAKDDYIRVIDTGASSISFGHMEFTYLGPSLSAPNKDDPGFTLPILCELHGNFPNPFNAGTMIHYTLHDAAAVNLEIYDLMGRKQATLVEKQQSPGFYSIRYNPLNLSSGTYYIRLSVGYMHLTSSMIYIK
ncbi:T9SS type A sorting domain-containing protein [candidate division KSB1 bacterium]|nr:T9SS type A sorting domain-containing protein [candidate division KSB1 bacterium]